MLENIIDGFVDFLVDELDTYITAASTTEVPLTELENNTINFGYPDLEKVQKKFSIFHKPVEESYEQLTMNTQSVTLTYELYIVVSKDTAELLYKKVNRYAECIKELIDDKPSLNGIVSFTRVSKLTYYDAVEGTQNTKAIQLDLEMLYEE